MLKTLHIINEVNKNKDIFDIAQMKKKTREAFSQ